MIFKPVVTLSSSLLLMGMMSAPAEAATGKQTPNRPNVLVIMADDLGWSDIGPFGGEIHTPNLDMLAAQGIRFSNFQVSPYSAPSRAMFLTGADPHESGVGNLTELNTKEQMGQEAYMGKFNNRTLTLPQRLQQAGYETIMSGKWHLGKDDDHTPDKWGFDHSFAMLNGEANHFKQVDKEASPDGKDAYRLNGKPVDIPDDFYSSDNFADFMIQKIEQTTKDKPFFGYLAFTAPHSPLQAYPQDIAKYAEFYHEGPQALADKRLARTKQLGLVGKDVKPHQLLGVPKWSSLSFEERLAQTRRMQIYAAMIDRMDYNIGRVIQTLRAKNQLDNTVIVFLSDNGAAGASREGSGKWGAWISKNRYGSLENMGKANSYVSTGPSWAQASMSPFALFKGFTTEGGIRSPLIMTGPGIAKNKIDGGYTNLKDLTPTLLNLTRTSTQTPADKIAIEGQSIVKQLKQPNARITGAKNVDVLEMRGGRQVRMGDYKALFISNQPMGIKVDIFKVDILKPQEWQLFNIVKDPGETNNLADKEPAILQKMIDAYDEYAKRVRVIDIAPVKTVAKAMPKAAPTAQPTQPSVAP